MNNKERPLKSWGVCCIQGKNPTTAPVADIFIKKLIEIYEGHGGVIGSHPQHGKKPYIGPGNLADGGEMVQKFWNATGNRYVTMLLFLIHISCNRLPDIQTNQS